MKSIEDLSSDLEFTKAKTGDERTVTFLPEPERADRRYTVISVDDHIVEPPHTFEGRVPAEVRRRARRGSSRTTTAARRGSTTASSSRTSASTPSSVGP